MDVVPLPTIVKLLELMGPLGLIAIVWYLDTRNFQKIVEDRRQETDKILKSYKDDVDTVKEMYRNNVKLVENYERMSSDLHELVVMNVRSLGILMEKIDQNEYCPALRVKKKTVDVEDKG